jgi:hypothetical protein
VTDSKPSEEALAMARELYAQFEHADDGNDVAALAAALQRFMDVVEKAEALADKQHQALQRIVEPWERAKRQYEAGAAVVLGFKERAEKAEASKAELIFAIEEWMSDALIELPIDAVELIRILDKHRGQP